MGLITTIIWVIVAVIIILGMRIVTEYVFFSFQIFVTDFFAEDANYCDVNSYF